jgi:hypothetical protein
MVCGFRDEASRSRAEVPRAASDRSLQASDRPNNPWHGTMRGKARLLETSSKRVIRSLDTASAGLLEQSPAADRGAGKRLITISLTSSPDVRIQALCGDMSDQCRECRMLRCRPPEQVRRLRKSQRWCRPKRVRGLTSTLRLSNRLQLRVTESSCFRATYSPLACVD